MKDKTLTNTSIADAKQKVSDLRVFGKGDLFKLIAKVASEKEGWMKSTKAMEIEDVGCLVLVTTQQGDHVAEALAFAPEVYIDGDGQHRTLRRIARARPGPKLDKYGYI